ncbi:unnamed protein product [Phaeothamnion confervicola]
MLPQPLLTDAVVTVERWCPRRQRRDSSRRYARGIRLAVAASPPPRHLGGLLRVVGLADRDVPRRGGGGGVRACDGVAAAREISVKADAARAHGAAADAGAAGVTLRRAAGGEQDVRCCIGALLTGGEVYWRPNKCDSRLMATPLARYVPGRTPVQELSPATMADAIRLLLNDGSLWFSPETPSRVRCPLAPFARGAALNSR